jgi:small-conductance mechanosensitive channel
MSIGDGLNGQPGEGAVSLSDLAASMDESDGEQAPDELPDTEEGEESEVDEADEAADEEDEQEEPTTTIKVDGKEITLKQSELVELAQKGTDYSQKTMAVAEDRKAVIAEREQVTQARAQVEQDRAETVKRLNAYSQFIESQVGQMPDVAMLDYDTAGYLRAKEQHEARKGQFQQAYAEIQRIQEESARQRQADIAERAGATEKALKDTLTGWNDDTLADLAKYADGLGLNPQTASEAMLSPGFWQLAHKAKAYDALLAKKAEMKPKAELSKVSKPSASNPTPRAEARKAEAFKSYRAKPSLDSLSKLVD